MSMDAIRAMRMLPDEARDLAQRIGFEENDHETSVLCALAYDGGAFTLSDDELSQAFIALGEMHGPIRGCACELAGEVCDLLALRAYVGAQVSKRHQMRGVVA